MLSNLNDLQKKETSSKTKIEHTQCGEINSYPKMLNPNCNVIYFIMINLHNFLRSKHLLKTMFLCSQFEVILTNFSTTFFHAINCHVKIISRATNQTLSRRTVQNVKISY